ncbi:MAG: flagellar export chaperone FliS [Opitutaceae bacterium]|nr:flagellar export chaperone FliS [Opitutaceae bacterium]
MAPPFGYARAYQAQSILTASPGQLVLMLFDGTLRFLNVAREAFAQEEDSPRRIENINTALVRAQNIIIELRATLNLSEGGEYAANLDRLYEYYLRRLIEANIRKQVEPVIEVYQLIQQLRDGWAEMLRKEESCRFGAAQGVA